MISLPEGSERGERPIDERKNILVSPCDGKLSVYRIGEGSRFFIKDTEYTVEQLLRNKKLADRYLGGYAMVFRLTVDDYHHYCYVADGAQSVNVTLPGVYHTVNPAANEVFPIYRENAREYTLLKTKEFGTILDGSSRSHDGGNDHQSFGVETVR